MSRDRKHMPGIDERERLWAFVDKVASRPAAVTDDRTADRYETKTSGEREQPAAWPAGEGVYAIVDHDGHAHLAYELELPIETGDIQEELRIESRASYVAAVRNPEASSPLGAGLGRDERPRYRKGLGDRFAGRRFAPLEPAFLDHEGAELVLIGADEEPEVELGVRLEAQRENADTAEIFDDLQLQRGEHAPLFAGAWG